MCVVIVYNTDLLVLFLKRELLLLDDLQLVSEIELSCLLLQLGEFVLILGHLLQRRLLAEEQNFTNSCSQLYYN